MATILIMSNGIFTETLPKNTAQLVTLLQAKKPEFLTSLYLSGGTGLSLLLGHRELEDLDFFTKNVFIPQRPEYERK